MSTMTRLLPITIVSGAIVGGVVAALLAVDASREAIGFGLMVSLTVVSIVAAYLTSPPIPTQEELEAQGHRPKRERPKTRSPS